nr:hypothetical protein [Tanacetum cinerariifolium]
MDSAEAGSPGVIIPYVPELEYPNYLVPSDAEAPLEDQPLPADASPTTASLCYVADFNPNEDLKEDPEDEDPFKDEEPFEDEEDDKEEEEHLALADSSVVPIVDPIPPAARLLPTGAPLGYKVARIRMRALLLSTSCRTDIPEADVPPQKRAYLTTLALKFKVRESSTTGAARHPGPTESDLRRCRDEEDDKEEEENLALADSFVVPIVDPIPPAARLLPTGAPLGYKVARIRMSALLLSTSCRTDIPEADVPPQKRACLTTLALKIKVRESSTTGATRHPGPTETNEFEVRFEEARDDRALQEPESTHCSEDRRSAIAAHVRTLEVHVATLITQSSSLQTQLTTTLGRIKILEARDPEPQEGPAEASKNGTYQEIHESNTCHHNHLTTTVTDAQLQALIDRGVAASLAEHDADKSRNGNNINDLGKGERRQMTTQREMFPKELAKVERYIGGLLDLIHDSVKASMPQSMQEAIKFATEMMDKKMLTHAECQAEHKRKFDDTSRNNQHQQ